MKIKDSILPFFDQVKEEGEKILVTVKKLLKKHKKLIVIGILVYVAYQLFFADEE